MMRGEAAEREVSDFPRLAEFQVLRRIHEERLVERPPADLVVARANDHLLTPGLRWTSVRKPDCALTPPRVRPGIGAWQAGQDA